MSNHWWFKPKDKSKEANMSNGKIKEGLPKTKEDLPCGVISSPVESIQQGYSTGLPWQAFAIVGDKDDPETWKLPHHTRAIFRAIKGKIGIEHTVDWDRMPAAVAALSPGGYRGQRVEASENDIISAARHLAAHYHKARKSVPDTLAVII